MATMAAKTARSVAQRADDAASTSAPAESVMPLVEAMWPCFPRAVRHTIRHCKPALGEPPSLAPPPLPPP